MILKPQIARAFHPLLFPKRFKGARGGRGGAKSRFFAALAVVEVLSSHQRFVCAREVLNSIADSSKQLLEDEIARIGMTDQFRITKYEISYAPTNSLFIFKGLQGHTVASVKSIEGFTRLWIDEAQTVSKNSLVLAIPTFRTEGSQIWASWNPKKADDPIELLFRDNKDDPDFECVTVNYMDNPWFPDVLRADMERDKRRDPDKYAHVWMGGYHLNSDAQVFKNWKVEDFDTPADAVFHHGADWGFSVDPTTLVRCFIRGDKLFVDREAYKVGCEIDNTPALFDKLDPDNEGVARNWVIRADSARPETISYMRRNGYPKIESALKGPSSIKDGIEFLKNYDIVVHPRCAHTIDELTHYSFKVDKHTNDVTAILKDKENHVIDALRYAVEGVRRTRKSQTKTLKGLF